MPKSTNEEGDEKRDVSDINKSLGNWCAKSLFVDDFISRQLVCPHASWWMTIVFVSAVTESQATLQPRNTESQSERGAALCDRRPGFTRLHRAKQEPAFEGFSMVLMQGKNRSCSGHAE